MDGSFRQTHLKRSAMRFVVIKASGLAYSHAVADINKNDSLSGPPRSTGLLRSSAFAFAIFSAGGDGRYQETGQKGGQPRDAGFGPDG